MAENNKSIGDIIKGLEICAGVGDSKCQECPYAATILSMNEKINDAIKGINDSLTDRIYNKILENFTKTRSEIDSIKSIILSPDCFHKDVLMEIVVPEDQDAEEYIDQYLDSILNEDVKYNCEWNFV